MYPIYVYLFHFGSVSGCLLCFAVIYGHAFLDCSLLCCLSVCFTKGGASHTHTCTQAHMHTRTQSRDRDLTQVHDKMHCYIDLLHLLLSGKIKHIR